MAKSATTCSNNRFTSLAFFRPPQDPLSLLATFSLPHKDRHERLRRDFDQTLCIEEVRMSVSSFHRHFKAVTAMSPLQFQKQLRLQEARRLMLGEDLGAA